MTANDYYKRISHRKRLTQREVLALLRRFMREHGVHRWKGCFVARFENDEVCDLEHRHIIMGRCDCEHQRINVSTKAIEMLRPHQIRLIILHEIAHALADVQGGKGHDYMWGSVARQIGVPRNAILHSVKNHPLEHESMALRWALEHGMLPWCFVEQAAIMGKMKLENWRAFMVHRGGIRRKKSRMRKNLQKPANRCKPVSIRST